MRSGENVSPPDSRDMVSYLVTLSIVIKIELALNDQCLACITGITE